MHLLGSLEPLQLGSGATILGSRFTFESCLAKVFHHQPPGQDLEGKGKDRVELLCIRERGIFGDIVLSRTVEASEQERRGKLGDAETHGEQRSLRKG